MWLRNIVCSVVTIAGVWALAHYWRELGNQFTEGNSLWGLAAFGALSLLAILGMLLIARAVDVHAARQRERMD